MKGDWLEDACAGLAGSAALRAAVGVLPALRFRTGDPASDPSALAGTAESR
jgi:hypothetical protein